jgi:ubiquinone/menaquinone biosynthesis C-methylase UbiE
MDKIFAEKFSKQPDEIINGDYFYHSQWYAEASAKASIEILKIPLEEKQKQDAEAWRTWRGAEFKLESNTLNGVFDPHHKPLWLISMYEKDRFSKLSKILNKIASEGKPFMEISCSVSMGLSLFIVNINPQIPCLVTDIDTHDINCLRLYRINRHLAECNINLAAFDNYNIPIKDNSLDYITSIRGISDIGSDNSPNNFDKLTVGKEQPISEVYRILKPGACFVTVETNKKWDFNSIKFCKAYNRRGKLFNIYDCNEIEEARNKLKAPSWREQFTAAGFQVETEEKYTRKSSGDEIRTELYHLTNNLKIHEWTDDEREAHKDFPLSTHTNDFDEKAEDYGIKFSHGEILYVLRKPTK